MMSIRSEQYDAFARDSWSSFVCSTLIHLKEDMSEYTKGMTDERLVDRIVAAAGRSAKYGLVDECDITCFLDAGLLLRNLSFDEDPRFAAIGVVLRDATLDPSDRAEQVLTIAYQQTLAPDW